MGKTGLCYRKYHNNTFDLYKILLKGPKKMIRLILIAVCSFHFFYTNQNVKYAPLKAGLMSQNLILFLPEYCP